MNLQETIRKVLKEEELNKTLMLRIKRRVDLKRAINNAIDFFLSYYKDELKNRGVQWFVETVIYNVYIEDVSPIFEKWDEYTYEMDITISRKEENKIMEFLTKSYYDVIAKRYNDVYGDKSLNEEINTDYAVIEILRPSSRMPSKWYFQTVPVNKTKGDKIYIKRGSSGILTFENISPECLELIYKGSGKSI